MTNYIISNRLSMQKHNTETALSPFTITSATTKLTQEQEEDMQL